MQQMHKITLVLTIWTLLFGLVVIATPVSAHVEAGAAQRCFEQHRFGTQLVDVAKTADGRTVLAQASWNWHEEIGCYLTLDDQAVAALRAAPPPQSLPDAITEASRECFERHRFGAQPVDVAKTADGRTVLARLSWGYHDAIGCFLVLDNSALATLSAAHTGSGAIGGEAQATFKVVSAGGDHSCGLRTGGTVACWGANWGGQADAPSGTFLAVSAGVADSCGVRTDGTIECWGRNFSGTSLAGAYETVSVGLSRYCGISISGFKRCMRRGRGPIGVAGRFKAVSAGGDHSCGVRTGGTVICWGADELGGLGDARAGAFTTVSAGSGHSCGVRTDGTVEC